MTPIQYTFVTQSDNKLREAELILRRSLQRCDLDLPELQAVDVEDVVVHKALHAYQAIGRKPVLIEDTGLYFEAFNGLPGALVKWFLKRTETEGMCRMLDPFPTRKAWAKTIVAVYDGQLSLFVGRVDGEIALHPRGDQGFGWDTIFIPDGETRTFGEMAPEEKMQYSMRRRAFQAMAEFESIRREE